MAHYESPTTKAYLCIAESEFACGSNDRHDKHDGDCDNHNDNCDLNHNPWDSNKDSWH